MGPEHAPTPKNPEHLMRPIKIRVLRPFCVRGQRVETGAEVELPAHVARDMIALKKAEAV